MIRLVKAFLFGITGLFIVITLLSLLITSKVKTSRVIIINNTTVDNIYKQTANLNNWKNWHPVFKPGVTVINIVDSSIGKNAACDIVYNNKTTHLVITSADTASIKFNLQSNSAKDIENDLVIIPLPQQHSVQVEWRVLNNLHWYPWEKFYAIFLDKITGPGYEDALNGLKIYLEKN